MTFISVLLKKHAELVFTDTDSLADNIKSEDAFDFSNYPKDLKFFDETNKKNIGKIEDEFEGKIIDESFGLKSKMYSMINVDGKKSNAAKGVNIATEFSEFKVTLFNKKVLRHKMRRPQGKKIKCEYTKSTKYYYHAFMIKD